MCDRKEAKMLVRIRKAEPREAGGGNNDLDEER